MGHITKQRIYNRGILSGREALKDMLQVVSDQRNENQNEHEIPPYTSQNG